MKYIPNTFSEKQQQNQSRQLRLIMPLHVCLFLFMNAVYLQGEDSVIVQGGHLFPR